MNQLAHNNGHISDSAERARAVGGRLGAFSRGFRLLRERVLGPPPEGAVKPERTIAEEAESAAELTSRGTIHKAGDAELVTAQDQMLRDARAKVSAEFSGPPKPEPSSVEDLFQK